MKLKQLYESSDKQLCKLNDLESGFYKTKLFLMLPDINYYKLSGDYSLEEFKSSTFEFLIYYKNYFKLFDNMDIIIKYEKGNDYVTECISGVKIPIAKDCQTMYYKIWTWGNKSYNCSARGCFINYNMDSYNKKYKLIFPYFVCVSTEGLDIHEDGNLDISNTTFFPCTLEEITHLTVKRGSKPIKYAYELPEIIWKSLKTIEKEYGTIEKFEKYLSKLESINKQHYIDWVEEEFQKENPDLSPEKTQSFVKQRKRNRKLNKFKKQEY